MEPQTFPAHRIGLVLPPGVFCCFFLLLVLGSPDIGALVFYGLMAVGSGWWFYRSSRAALILDDREIRFRGQFWTRRFPLGEVAAAEVVPMRTASPLAGRFPYCCIGLVLVDGRRAQFDDLAAPAAEAASIEGARAAIEARLPVGES